MGMEMIAMAKFMAMVMVMEMEMKDAHLHIMGPWDSFVFQSARIDVDIVSQVHTKTQIQ